jgi:hypothetical protein
VFNDPPVAHAPDALEDLTLSAEEVLLYHTCPTYGFVGSDEKFCTLPPLAPVYATI